jgi:hypothetical protein
VIVALLWYLQGRGLPLFPNRAGRQPGQTYACDIVVEIFKEVGVKKVSVSTVEHVWKGWRPDGLEQAIKDSERRIADLRAQIALAEKIGT